MSFSHLTCGRYLLIEHIVSEAEERLETNRKYIYARRDHLKTIKIDEEGCVISEKYLTIIRRRRSEYCRIIPETKSRGLLNNIH